VISGAAFKNDYKVAVLSRGTNEKPVILFWLQNNQYNDIGDESLQIKLKFPEIHVAVDNTG